MSGALALFGRTFLIGIAVAAPVGAMGVLCIQRTLAGGWRSGAWTGAGIATADGLYAATAAFGVTAVSAALIAWQTPLRLAGGAVLVYLGIRAALRTPTPTLVSQPAEATPGLRAYSTAITLTLTNPMTIMAFAAVFAGAGLATGGGAAEAGVATAGVGSGSLAWWLTLATGVALTRHALSPRALRAVSVCSGVAVAGFGVFAILSAL